MANQKHIKILNSGIFALEEFRKENPFIQLDLSNSDLRYIQLKGINLCNANLNGANLAGANLENSKLTNIGFIDSKLHGTSFKGSIINNCDFRVTNFTNTDLSGCRLENSNFGGSIFKRTLLNNTQFKRAIFGETKFYDLNLSDTLGLDMSTHFAPSDINVNTLTNSFGRISKYFLQGCGFSEWSAMEVRLYDHRLSASEIVDLQYSIFDKRSKGFFIGGVFISYSQRDEIFADKLYYQLKNDGVAVWMDRQDMVSGPIEFQVQSAIRANDIILPILSENSIKSDWVEAELDWAREREKEENRSVLCPIAIDDSWKTIVNKSVLWRQVKKYNILSFSSWKDDQLFDLNYGKLVKGMKLFYS